MKTFHLLPLGAFALVLLARPARADDASTSELAARRGDVSLGSGIMVVPNLAALSDDPFATTFAPVLLEAGMFVAEHVEVGGLAQIAPSLDSTWRGLDLRFGGTVRYHTAPHARLAPWLGASLGFEYFASDHVSTHANGVFALAQAGLDWRVTRGLSLGPYVALGPTFGAATSVLPAHGGDISTSQAFLVFSGGAGARVGLSF